MPGHVIGYARVSTADQDPALQIDALETAGCHRVFTDRASGAVADARGAASSAWRRGYDLSERRSGVGAVV